MPATATTFSMSSEVVSAPLATTYRYARATDTTCTLARVEFTDGRYSGRGEGSPFESFFASDASATRAALSAATALVQRGVAPHEVIERVPDMPAKNAIEAAWLDYRAKSEGTTVAQILGIASPGELTVMTTIAMGDRVTVENDLERTKNHPLLKLKLGSADDVERLDLVRRRRPDARLVVDVNGGWSADQLADMLPALLRAGVEMLEQPVSQAEEETLAHRDWPIPVIADESFSTHEDLQRLVGKYDGVNIKLDKCGGLTAALACINGAKDLGMRVMIGCLPASSLSTAAGIHAAQFAEWIDLDNHLWMRDDIAPSIGYRGGTLSSPSPELWG